MTSVRTVNGRSVEESLARDPAARSRLAAWIDRAWVRRVAIPLLLLASIWYLIMTSILTVGQFYLERYFGRGTAQRQTMLERLWNNLRARRTARQAAVEGRER